MKKIALYTEQLLIQHDYAVIPDFGGFVIQKKTAEIKNGTIIAPRKVVAFNVLLQHNDGMLALEICRREGISYREASLLLKSELDSLHHELETNPYIRFGNLGYLKKLPSNKILFKPGKVADFLPDNFGVNNIRLPKQLKKKKSIPLQPVSRSKQVFRYAAVAGLLIAFSLLPQHIGFEDTEYAQILPNKEQTISREVSSEDIIVLEYPESQESVFYIVVGSYENLSDAEKLCKNLWKKKHHQARILSSFETYHVVIDSFKKERTALDYMKHLRKEKRFREAWILSVR